MRVLIADKLPPSGVRAIADLGIEVIERPELQAADLPGALAESGAEVLVVRSTKVTAEAFAAAPRLGLVVRAGAGVNTIDITAANRHGVFVSNCPGKNAIAVAELTLALILSLDRRIPDAVATMRQGLWNKKRFGQAEGLHGRRLGLVGFGHIGREVASRARAFGLVVEVFDPSLDRAAAEGTLPVRRYSSMMRAASADVARSACSVEAPMCGVAYRPGSSRTGEANGASAPLGSSSNTSSAARILPERTASASAPSSRTPPRAVCTTSAPSLSSASSRPPMRWCVAFP